MTAGRALLGFAILFSLLLGASPAPAAGGKDLCLAVVKDGPSWHFDGLVRDTLRELGVLLGPGRPVRVKVFDAGWELSRVPRLLERALADRSCRAVLVLGMVATRTAMDWPRPLPKPVVSGFFVDAADLGLKVNARGVASRPNLNYLFIPDRVRHDYRMIQRLFRPACLAVLVDAKVLEGWPGFAAHATRAAREEGIARVKVVPMGRRADEVLARLGPEVDAVYLTPPLRMIRAEQEALVRGINRRRLRSYAMLGLIYVREGVLAGLVPDLKLRLARRLALNLQQIEEGTPPRDLPSRLVVEERLFLNAATARAVGYWPDFALYLDATWIGSPEPVGGRPLDIEQAMLMAAQRNLEIEVQKARSEQSRQEERRALGYLLPHLEAKTLYQGVDPDRADASMGALPKERTAAGVTLSQVIFDDAVISGYRAAGRLTQGARQRQEAKRLELMALAARRYLNYLSARALVRIAENDLRLTQKNLELAKVRVRVGMSGKEELFRLASAEAQRKSALVRRRTRLEQALTALNQVLNQPQESRWRARDLDLDSQATYLLRRMLQVITNRRQVRLLEPYLIHQAQANSPELKALDRSLEALRIKVAQLGRRYYLPTLQAQLGYSYIIDRRSGVTPPVVFTAPPPVADRHDWSAAVVLKFPLYEGGGRAAELARAKARLRGLQKTRELAAQRLEQQVRTILENMGYTHPHIGLSRRAYENAARNLKVVQDKYGRGKARLIDLLDAQNQALRQRQSATLAVYAFLNDYYRLQRALSWFEAGHSRAEVDAWLREVKRYLRRQQAAGQGRSQ